jgi:hypothetical protein
MTGAPSRAALAPIATTPRAKALDAVDVYRFFNRWTGVHFYTANAPSARTSSRPGRSSPTRARSGARRARRTPAWCPVWRFFNRDTGAHFYTTDNAERQRILVTWPQFADEGAAFYAYPTDAFDRMPVHRFYNTQTQTHFYTAEETEKDFVQRTYPAFAYEGVSYYAIALPPSPAALAKRDAFRLVDQATFGPTGAEVDRAFALGAAAWVDEQLAKARERLPAGRVLLRVARRERGLQVQRRARHADLPLRRGPAHAVQAALALLHQRALRARPAPPARRVGALADPRRVRHEGPGHGDGVRAGALPPDARRQRVRQLRGAALPRHAVAGDGPLPRHGRQREGRPGGGTEPNENYARELLQLFSIGTIELKRDGTPLLDATSQPGADLRAADVKAFARALTGWTYPPYPGTPPKSRSRPSRCSATTACRWSRCRRCTTAARSACCAGSSCRPARRPTRTCARCSATSSCIPNVGPFIGRQLIRHLVTGTPTPAYVDRVAAVFDNDGTGMRGNLKAVVRAILLDPRRAPRTTRTRATGASASPRCT